MLDEPKSLEFEELSIGQNAQAEFFVTKDDVLRFAEVTGDHNPIHVDEAYAAQTPFRERIAHGALIGSYVSALISRELPGLGSVGISTALRFKRPVKFGSMVATTVTITDLEEHTRFVTLKCLCLVNRKTVIEGEAVVYVPPHKK